MSVGDRMKEARNQERRRQYGGQSQKCLDCGAKLTSTATACSRCGGERLSKFEKRQ